MYDADTEDTFDTTCTKLKLPRCRKSEVQQSGLTIASNYAENAGESFLSPSTNAETDKKSSAILQNYDPNLNKVSNDSITDISNTNKVKRIQKKL